MQSFFFCCCFFFTPNASGMTINGLLMQHVFMPISSDANTPGRLMSNTTRWSHHMDGFVCRDCPCHVLYVCTLPLVATPSRPRTFPVSLPFLVFPLCPPLVSVCGWVWAWPPGSCSCQSACTAAPDHNQLHKPALCNPG